MRVQRYEKKLIYANFLEKIGKEKQVEGKLRIEN
jgi:hypothetical protein